MATMFYRSIHVRSVIPILSSPVRGYTLQRHVFPRIRLVSVSGLFESVTIRFQSTQVTALSNGERRIAEKIKANLNTSRIEVEDISGGCGSMYRIFVASTDFKGKRTLQQHRIVNDILKDEVKDMHGLTIETTTS